MKTKKGLKMLEVLQCLYQQKIITQTDKTEIAKIIKTSMKTGDYTPVVLKLKNIQIPIETEKYQINNAIKMLND